MSDDQNIFKQKPLLLSQYMTNENFINNIWTTSNLDHPSNNSLKTFLLAQFHQWHFSACTNIHSVSLNVVEHGNFYHAEWFHAQGMTDTVFGNTVRVTAVLKPPFCLLSLFQNYLLHCPHIFSSSATWPPQQCVEEMHISFPKHDTY